jgi:hypothetical protein
MHDKYIKVPDFNNMLTTQLDSVVTANNIRYEISDTIFDRSRTKGIVVNQDPEPFTDVKKNRKIYLTINSLQTRKVVFPDIYDEDCINNNRKNKENFYLDRHIKCDNYTNRLETNDIIFVFIMGRTESNFVAKKIPAKIFRNS